MSTRRELNLEEALLDPGFTPGKKHFRALLDAVASSDETVAKKAEGALVRAQNDVGPLLLERYEGGTVEAQRAFARLAGRHASSRIHTNASEILERALHSSDVRVRRAAVNAIGRARIPNAEALLVGALERETDSTVRPRLVEALGKIGGEAARAAIARTTNEATGAQAKFETARAALMADRTTLRTERSEIRADASIGPVKVALRCRRGLERILLSELAPEQRGQIAPEAFGPGCVDATLKGPLASLFSARTFLEFGIASEPIVARSPEEMLGGLVATLTSASTLKLLRSLTTGPIRYRIHFGAGGKHRRLIWEAALEVARRAPDLVNDPTDSVWEAVVVDSRRGLVRIELVPKVDDPRFTYRVADVPAASHPTIAAALVRVAGARADDVVWDPFVGSGLELVERSLLGPSRVLYGTDVDPRALEIARENLASAGARAELSLASALAFFPPKPVTAIITNPPMGRRVLRGEKVTDLLVRFLGHAATVLSKGGRLVWMSPAPRETRRAGERSGLRLAHANPVDLGGLDVELQEWTAG